MMWAKAVSVISRGKLETLPAQSRKLDPGSEFGPACLGGTAIASPPVISFMSPSVRSPAMNSLRIRPMRPDEISIAVNWATAEGWNPDFDGVLAQQQNYTKSGFELAYANVRQWVSLIVADLSTGKWAVPGAYSKNGDNCQMQLRRRVRTH